MVPYIRSQIILCYLLSLRLQQAPLRPCLLVLSNNVTIIQIRPGGIGYLRHRIPSLRAAKATEWVQDQPMQLSDNLSQNNTQKNKLTTRTGRKRKTNTQRLDSFKKRPIHWHFPDPPMKIPSLSLSTLRISEKDLAFSIFFLLNQFLSCNFYPQGFR